MEKLVDIVHFLHVEIQDTFGPCGKFAGPVFVSSNQLVTTLLLLTCLLYMFFFVPVDGKANESQESRQTLGSAGLSLHYANIISQIDNIVSFF